MNNALEHVIFVNIIYIECIRIQANIQENLEIINEK